MLNYLYSHAKKDSARVHMAESPGLAKKLAHNSNWGHASFLCC
jgi:hypothetical protein